MKWYWIKLTYFNWNTENLSPGFVPAFKYYSGSLVEVGRSITGVSILPMLSLALSINNSINRTNTKKVSGHMTTVGSVCNVCFTASFVWWTQQSPYLFKEYTQLFNMYLLGTCNTCNRQIQRYSWSSLVSAPWFQSCAEYLTSSKNPFQAYLTVFCLAALD